MRLLHRLTQGTRPRCASLVHHCRSRAAVGPAMASALSGPVFFLDDFAVRQWTDPNYSGTRLSFDQAEFMSRLHAAHAAGRAPLVDGYAPFCKHVFVPNFAGARVGALRITPQNVHLLRSGYSARTPTELPVLQRWFTEADVAPVPEAAFLDVILYSREQLVLERAATGRADDAHPLPDAPWGVISVKAQNEAHELPMQPITALRNALGREEGGSGVSIDRHAYSAAVAYWQEHAPVVAGASPSGD